MSRPTAHPRAFTLIELVLVVAIVAVFAAIALPRFGNADNAYRADLAARKLAADLAWARTAAIARSAPVTLTLNTSAHTYTLSGAVSDATLGTVPDLSVDLTHAPFGARFGRTSLVSRSALVSSTSVTFNEHGVPSAQGTITLISRTASRTVTLHAPGGAITIE